MSSSSRPTVFELRPWRISKFPLRMIARISFLTYMWAGAIQLSITPEYQRSNEQMKANGLEYLTLQGFLGTTLALIIAMFAEFFPCLKGTKVGFNGFFLVIETMITVLYWSLYLISPNLIIDQEASNSATTVPPLFMDTAGHLVPFVSMLFEFLYSRTSKRHLLEQRLVHLSAISIFTFGYFAWILYLFNEDKNFPYPFLRMMNHAGRTAFTVFAMFLGLFIYGLANRAYLKYHATEDDLPLETTIYYDDDDDDDKDSIIENV